MRLSKDRRIFHCLALASASRENEDYRFDQPMHPFTLFLILYTGSALVGVTCLWVLYDRRDKRSFEDHRRQKVLFCVRCNKLYAVKKRDVSEGVPCPKCEYKNYELSY